MFHAISPFLKFRMADIFSISKARLFWTGLAQMLKIGFKVSGSNFWGHERNRISFYLFSYRRQNRFFHRAKVNGSVHLVSVSAI